MHVYNMALIHWLERCRLLTKQPHLGKQLLLLLSAAAMAPEWQDAQQELQSWQAAEGRLCRTPTSISHCCKGCR